MVPLAVVDPLSAREETRADLDLAAVYTALMTQQTEAPERGTLAPERESRRLSAVEVLNSNRLLALLGDPGSGKSTFVNFVALCMAGELLQSDTANLKLLTSPCRKKMNFIVSAKRKRTNATTVESRAVAPRESDPARSGRARSASRGSARQRRYPLEIHRWRVAGSSPRFQ